jgi:hypothetical protein
MSEGGRVFALAQVMIWVCNALGGFATADEISAIIDDFEYRDGERERLMAEGFMRLQSPRFRDDGEEIVEEPSIFTEPALSRAWARARQAVTKAVQEHSLRFSGRREGAKGFPATKTKEVDPRHCRHIVFRDGDTPYAEVAIDPNLMRPPRPARWHMVRFDAAAVVAMWPHPSAVQEKRRKVPDSELIAWLKKRLAERDRVSPFPAEAALWKAAENDLRGRISRDRFREAWRGVRPAELADPGRRPGSKVQDAPKTKKTRGRYSPK